MCYFIFILKMVSFFNPFLSIIIFAVLIILKCYDDVLLV